MSFNRLSFTIITLISVVNIATADTLTLPDGGYFEGDTKNNLLHGDGTLTWSNGDTYIGQFEKGLMTGQGNLTYANGDEYNGQFLNGDFSGQGTFINTDKEQWQGEFQNHTFIEGTQTSRDKSTFTGTFESWQLHGDGEVNIPNVGHWQGEFVYGQLTGKGQYTSENGDHYTGGFEQWNYHGEGELTHSDSSFYIGKFLYGQYSGKGILKNVVGDIFEGEFRWGKLDGKARIDYINGDQYDGQYRAGKFSGEGTFFEKLSDTTKSGIWNKGILVSQKLNGDIHHVGTVTEQALYLQNTLLENQFSTLKPSDPDQTNLYFLAVAGDGSQGVFRREIEYASQLFAERFQAQGRIVMLANSAQSATDYPMATVTAIDQALQTIASVIDKENDILFIYLTSHGSSDHRLYLNQNGMSLTDLSATYLAQQLDKLKIRHKVIAISACYAGGFIDQLKNQNTLIMTAADHDKTSFGCSDDADFTFFGRALFEQALQKTHDFRRAFHIAYDLIDQWEDEKDYDHSKPQLYAPEPILEKLDQWYAGLDDYTLQKLTKAEQSQWWWREIKIIPSSVE